MALTVVHGNFFDQKVNQGKLNVSLQDDPLYLSDLRMKFIEQHNQKFQKNKKPVLVAPAL